ncbi:TetR/AcrR family transcriptional regulator [Variovorax arabinosiphilus]|uniref:TetR/AcrR family transcriptional regulator n=1 Tax=Variovorax arabinosiphilus TaxID=3053498 RepID=UPI002576AD04|nr:MULTISPECIES: TetR/AcrR family transcriptional regulator [unclassified Variovorax]MDM0118372.1 TetR/AcrR family transcriptional regulator [Variovorax sp. J2L1-78]MDM0128797.1 TetR/AcrR family transcriptional regulator [Variovorax sp. J2L1-63]MDM0233417.1 TetR/AcrR family transcriptional regulator [Variovorax sp. J2R1-6]
MRYDAEHKQRTRLRILRHAAAALRRQGPQDISVGSVMQEAGLTHGGFYAHFPSKDALIEASIAFMFDDSLALWERAAHGKPVADGLASYIDAYLSASHLEAVDNGCPLAALATEAPRMSAMGRQAFTAGINALTALLQEALDQLDAPPPTALATSVLAELVGALTLARIQTDVAQATRILETCRLGLKRRLGLGAAFETRAPRSKRQTP